MKEQRENLVIGLYQFDLLNACDEADDLLLGIIGKLSLIDEIIEENLFNYTIDRLSFVDRAIIRLATYELKFTDTASPIIIDEAIKLTKKYSDLDDEKQHKFNNKVLDSIAKNLRG